MAAERTTKASTSTTKGRSVVQVLLRSHGSRWGPGKTHYAEICQPGRYVVALCTGKPIHAEEIRGTSEQVTCRRCRLRYADA